MSIYFVSVCVSSEPLPDVVGLQGAVECAEAQPLMGQEGGEEAALDQQGQEGALELAYLSGGGAGGGASDGENASGYLNQEEPPTDTSVVIEMSGAQPLLELTPMTGNVWHACLRSAFGLCLSFRFHF